MIFYKYTYRVTQDLDTAFNYFLQKKYFGRYFSEKDGAVRIDSTFPDDELIRKNERITIVNEDGRDIFEINYEVLAIENFSEIKMKMTYVDFMDKEEALDVEEEEELQELMSNILGNCYYTIQFIPLKNGRLEIIEKSEIKDTTFLYKMYWKFIGLRMRLQQSKIHKEVREEIELL